MNQRFFVDYSDQAFPQILPVEQSGGNADPLTIGEARQEIIDHFRAQIDHARNQILRARQTTAESVLEETKINHEDEW